MNRLTNTIEIMKSAKRYLKKGWCKYHSALDKYGNFCPSWHENACAWCATGAIRRASFEYNNYHEYSDQWAKIAFSKISGIDDIAFWNDDPAQTQNKVLETFDCVINHLVDINDTNRQN